MGRRRKGKFILWRISIPETLALEVELAIVDSRNNKPIYGYRSQLVTNLLLNFVNETRKLTNQQPLTQPLAQPLTTGDTNEPDNSEPTEPDTTDAPG